MEKISVVIISLNEELTIARCLESVKDIADEIVVVDSFSQDNTEKICLEYGSVFSKHKFEGYILQKNYALSKASNNMILSLDADEELSKELQDSILKIKNNFFADGYSMNRLTKIGDNWIKHSGWYPDTKIRLFNREKGKWTGLNPHDEFKYFNEAKIELLKGDLLHHSFNSFNDLSLQSNKFAKLSAKAYFQEGKKAPLFKLIINPALRFFRDYFFNAGILNGVLGWKVCLNNTKSTFLKYKYLRQLYNNESMD